MNFYPSLPSQHPKLQLLRLFVCLFSCSRAEPSLTLCWWPCCLCWDAELELPINPGLALGSSSSAAAGGDRALLGGSGGQQNVPLSLCRHPEWHFPQQVTAGGAAASAIPIFLIFFCTFSRCPSGFVSLQSLKFKITSASLSAFPVLSHTSNLQENKSLPSPAPRFPGSFVCRVPAEPPPLPRPRVG